jgi:hypothetical protein
MKPRGLYEEFARGRAPELHQVLGVFTQNNAVLGLNVMDARRINDGIFTGPKGAYQRYNVSGQATNVAQIPYGSAQ